MKQSKFTSVLPIDSEYAEVVIHNTFTNALATLTRDKYTHYKNVISNNILDVPHDFIDELIAGGYVVDDDLDEMLNYEFHHDSARFNSASLVLTIAPSLDCQFACPYCYEAGVDKSEHMSKDTQTALINFIRRYNPRSLRVHWYGGEPLMQMDIIEHLTSCMLDYCENNVTSFEAEIVTNAYLMNEEMLKRMLHCRISKAQITIDGSKETHDSRRYLINGGSTYDIIMNNIENAMGRIRIDLRVNIDQTNVDKINQLTDELARRDILDNVHAYIGHVTSTSEYDNNCISRRAYAQLEDDWYEQLATFSKANKYNKLYHYPLQTMTRCMAETETGYVVGPDGLLYKCWNHIGRKDLSIGSIYNEKQVTSNLLLQYTMTRDIYDRGCSECKILPYCGGGCLDEYLRFGIQKCHPRKFNYDKYIIGLAHDLLRAKSK